MKSGLDYFPLDCQLNDKFELIEAEYGLTGFSVIIKLLQKIYSGEGYYCEWSREVALLFSRRLGREGGDIVQEIVSAAVERGIFDRKLYEQYGILTSKGIQRRYLEAASRRRKVSLKGEYLLLPREHLPKNVDISGENADISEKNEDIFAQRKGEERKEKESRGKESIAAARTVAYAEHDLHGNIQLSQEEYEQLCEAFGRHNTEQYIARMSAYQAEKGKYYTDHARKLREWMETDRVRGSSYELEELRALKNLF